LRRRAARISYARRLRYAVGAMTGIDAFKPTLQRPVQAPLIF
jgi:hypothetical protein